MVSQSNYPDEMLFVRPEFSGFGASGGFPVGYKALAQAEFFEPSRSIDVTDDMLGDLYIANNCVGPMAFTSRVSGAAAGVSSSTTLTNATYQASGVAALNTGTSGVGRAALTCLTSGVMLGFQNHRLAGRFIVDNLSTVGVQQYTVVWGFHDGLGTSTIDPGNGVFFKYDRALSANWLCYCFKGGVVAGPLDTTIPVTQVTGSGAMQLLEVEVSEAADYAFFRINGVLVGTITTQIPNTIATALGMRILQSVGTTPRNLYCDWVRYRTQAGVSRP